VIAIVGAATALFAASIAVAQQDIKKVLAYSTVSQLGYMVAACGVGAFAAGVFHLMTHAFFKALLFLGSGSVIHGMSGEQDMRKMGGLRQRMPVTHLTMLIGCIAIAGVPPLAGFFSKDEILWSAFKIGGYGRVVWALGFATAAMTAFYMFRLYYMTFHGAFRGTEEQAHHLHESPKAMTVPLMVLAGGSILAGFIGIPPILGNTINVPNVFEHFLHPVLANAHHALEQVFPHPLHDERMEWSLMVASVLVAVAGLFLARFLYKSRPELSEKMASGLAPVHRLLTNKFYVDELYGALFVRGLALGGGRALFAVDRHGIDGGDGEVKPALGVNGLAWLVRDAIARASNAWDRYVVDMLVNAVAVALEQGSYLFRSVQNGLVQHYALAMIIGVFFLIAAGKFVLGLY